jgi:hypothetical protein
MPSNHVRESIGRMKTELKQNLKNPENHPKYEEEWRKFYVERSRNVTQVSKQPDNNLTKDWIKYWPQRMVHMYNEDVVNIKQSTAKK